MGMLIADINAEEEITKVAEAAFWKIRREMEAAEKRGVKTPSKAVEVKIARAEYWALLTCLRYVNWELLCRSDPGALHSVDGVWESDIAATLEKAWLEKREALIANHEKGRLEMTFGRKQ
jgi:hypothetical protein